MSDSLTEKPGWLQCKGVHLCRDDVATKITTVRLFEKWLRAHGWPHAAAKKIASHGFAALVGEETEEMQLLREMHKILASQNGLR